MWCTLSVLVGVLKCNKAFMWAQQEKVTENENAWHFLEAKYLAKEKMLLVFDIDQT